MAGNTALVDIEVDYTFTNVGAVQAIIAPGAVWTESPGPSMSGAPSASPSN
jgi:hypothetical protein